jgi:hypothetical protein
MVELISVHMPKCAGTSFRAALEEMYGKDAIHFDYDDRVADPAAPVNIDPVGFRERAIASGYPELHDKRVVHGHLHVGKYDGLPDSAKRITFLRDPVRRTISHYFFWRHYRRHGHTIHDYMLDHDLDLVEFATLPSIAGFYRDVFFRGVEGNRFDLIGSVENLDRDVERLEELLGREVPVGRTNPNPDPEYQRLVQDILDDRATMHALEQALAGDIDLYRTWTQVPRRQWFLRALLPGG